MISKEEIHICIPAFNEEPMIACVVRGVVNCGFSNVVVVDDGSTDGTAKRAKAAGAKVIRHPVNRGCGAATQTALEYARGRNISYLLMMDGDGQHDPECICKLVKKLSEKDVDLVIGSRFILQSVEMPIKRQVYNRIANVLTNSFCKKNYSDTQSGFRLLNRHAIEALDLHTDRFEFCSEMLISAEQQGLRTCETPIAVRYSNYSLRKGQNFNTGVVTSFNLLRHIFGRKKIMFNGAAR